MINLLYLWWYLTFKIKTANYLVVMSQFTPFHGGWSLSSENPEQSAERVVTVRLQDVNDNYPMLVEKDTFICMMKPQPVIIKAHDGDSAPYSEPFTFSFANPNKSPNWQLTTVDGTLTHQPSKASFVWIMKWALQIQIIYCILLLCVIQGHQLNWCWGRGQPKRESSHFPLTLKTVQDWESHSRSMVSYLNSGKCLTTKIMRRWKPNMCSKLKIPGFSSRASPSLYMNLQRCITWICSCRFQLIVSTLLSS